jgi:hypothetical protein
MDLLKALRYLLLCFALWIVVDWGTAGGFRMAYFETYMPTLLLFYLGYPAIFTWLVFGLKLSEKWLFAATLVAIFIVEVLFVHNPLVMNFPVCLAGIPLAVAVYAPLTYFPLWIVRGEVRRHLALMIFLTLVELAVIFLTTFGSGH